MCQVKLFMHCILMGFSLQFVNILTLMYLIGKNTNFDCLFNNNSAFFKHHLAMLSDIISKSWRHTPNDSNSLVYLFIFRHNRRKISLLIFLFIFSLIPPPPFCSPPHNCSFHVEFICYKTWPKLCTVIPE